MAAPQYSVSKKASAKTGQNITMKKERGPCRNGAGQAYGGNDGLALLSGAKRNGKALRTGRARRAAVLRLDFWLLFIKEK
jgi:hypothetical protein